MHQVVFHVQENLYSPKEALIYVPSKGQREFLNIFSYRTMLPYILQIMAFLKFQSKVQLVDAHTKNIPPQFPFRGYF